MPVIGRASGVGVTRRATLMRSIPAALSALLPGLPARYANAVPSRHEGGSPPPELAGQGRRTAAGPVARAGPASLPPTPLLPSGAEAGFTPLEGGRIFRAVSGRGRAVVFLHGGLANANYWGHQVAGLGSDRQAVAIDFMGHGRSSPTAGPITYASLARSVVGVLDQLHIPKAAIVGWSDGAIVGLELALRHADRVEGIFCLGANYDRGGLIPGGGLSGAFPEYVARTRAEYQALSPQPTGYENLRRLMSRMWATEPNYSRRELANIRVPTVVAAGEFDEIIRRGHTQELAASIPGSKLIIEPGTSHFAMLQNPGRLTTEISAFVQS